MKLLNNSSDGSITIKTGIDNKWGNPLQILQADSKHKGTYDIRKMVINEIEKFNKIYYVQILFGISINDAIKKENYCVIALRKTYEGRTEIPIRMRPQLTKNNCWVRSKIHNLPNKYISFINFNFDFYLFY